jgi:hypothetical protein
MAEENAPFVADGEAHHFFLEYQAHSMAPLDQLYI